MQERIFIALITVLFCMVLIWFVLLSYLFASLRKRHEATYVSLGRPSLFVNNNLATTHSLLKFLLARHYRRLNDLPLERLCNFLVAFFVVYLVLFFGGILLVLAPYARHVA
jgi:hypothetical protein